jgi:hypothetical protein
MEGELGAGARIAIALIVLAVLLSVIFVILGFTRGTTNEGVTSVQNSMDQMNLAQFEDYNQRQMSGAQVLSALKLFEGRPIGVVVVNIMPNRAVASPIAYNLDGDVGILKRSGAEITWVGFNYGALFTPPGGVNVQTWNSHAFGTGSGITTPIIEHVPMGTGPAGTAAMDTLITTTGMHRGGAYSYYIANLLTREDGSNITNNNTAGTLRSGQPEFIRGTARYMARLVRDTTGTITGIVFVQIS